MPTAIIEKQGGVSRRSRPHSFANHTAELRISMTPVHLMCMKTRATHVKEDRQYLSNALTASPSLSFLMAMIYILILLRDGLQKILQLKKLLHRLRISGDIFNVNESSIGISTCLFEKLQLPKAARDSDLMPFPNHDLREFWTCLTLRWDSAIGWPRGSISMVHVNAMCKLSRRHK